jgi:hypothetical protein
MGPEPPADARERKSITSRGSPEGLPALSSARVELASENDLPPYEMSEVLAQPYAERTRLLARSWAAQVNPNPLGVLAAYWLKYFLVFAGGWAFFCSFSAGYAGFLPLGSWAFSAAAFQKAILWALFYELAGFGCSSGPMNARFWPPLGGFLHFLRPGTTKLPLFPGVPVFGGIRRTWLDVTLYAANQLLLIRALVAPEPTVDLLLPSCILIPLLGITDKTLFLAARAEHYWVALVCLSLASGGDVWIAACQLIWAFIWFWAATSKVNHHFPSVIMVMMNAGPFFPKRLKRRLFASYPDDLRPSKQAAAMAHMGTFVEYMIPVVLLASESSLVTAAGLLMMLGFHSFIATNNPSGMPVEWNILMVYGGFFLFGHNPEVSVLAVGSQPLLMAFLFVMLVAIPLYGNLVPSRVSFLMAMRYYAGNWAYNVWLFRGDSSKKLARLTKASGTMRQQLERLLDDEVAVDTALAMSTGHRFLHLEGKVLNDALPHAIDGSIDDYEWMDGEILGGMVLGWNFGDGHLNGRQLLDAVQRQCGFEAGELRVVMVESQPLFGRTMSWKVADAVSGLLAEGKSEIAPLRKQQPWPTGPAARALEGTPG